MKHGAARAYPSRFGLGLGLGSPGLTLASEARSSRGGFERGSRPCRMGRSAIKNPVLRTVLALPSSSSSKQVISYAQVSTPLATKNGSVQNVDPPEQGAGHDVWWVLCGPFPSLVWAGICGIIIRTRPRQWAGEGRVSARADFCRVVVDLRSHDRSSMLECTGKFDSLVWVLPHTLARSTSRSRPASSTRLGWPLKIAQLIRARLIL